MKPYVALLIFLAACEQPSGETINLPVDIENERGLQRSVDEGHQPWRLDAAFVACSEIAGIISARQKAQPDLNACLDEQRVQQASATLATVALATADGEFIVRLRRVAKPDRIWTPMRIEIHPRQ